nr:hypothetical protein CFP56_29864 [Quercus suber]
MRSKEVRWGVKRAGNAFSRAVLRVRHSPRAVSTMNYSTYSTISSLGQRRAEFGRFEQTHDRYKIWPAVAALHFSAASGQGSPPLAAGLRFRLAWRPARPRFRLLLDVP